MAIFTTGTKNPLIDTISQQIASISSKLKALTPQIGALTQAKQAGMTITPQTTVEQARGYTPQTSSPGATVVQDRTITPVAPQKDTPQVGSIYQNPFTASSSALSRASSKELPFQTYERTTGQKWSGGSSPDVVAKLKEFGITAAPGSSDANLELQKRLLGTSSSPTLPPPADTNPPASSDKTTPDTSQFPTAITPDTLSRYLSQYLNQPFDYGAEAGKAKTAYENLYGTPERRIETASAETTRLYNKARDEAVKEIKGSLATRGLLDSGVAEKEIADTEKANAVELTSALAKLRDTATSGEQKAVWDWISEAVKSRSGERERALGLLPEILKAGTPETKIIGSGETGYYSITYDPKTGKEVSRTQIIPPVGNSSATKFSGSQINKGAAIANIPIEDFKTLSDDDKNYFINNSLEIKKMKKVIDEAKKNNDDPTTIEAEISLSNSPDVVKDYLVRYLWSVFPRPEEKELPWWKKLLTRR